MKADVSGQLSVGLSSRRVGRGRAGRGGAGRGRAGTETTLSPGDNKGKGTEFQRRGLCCCSLAGKDSHSHKYTKHWGSRRTSVSQLCVTCWDLGVWP